MLVCLFSIFQSALDLSDVGYSKEGKLLLVYQEEDQGQANQGKPSKLAASLIPVFTYA
jgi:hypothetical protein